MPVCVCECVCLTLVPCVLSRLATEGSLRTDPISMKPESPGSPRLTGDTATPQQSLSSAPAHFTITSSSNPAHCELVSVFSSSPIMAQRSCSSALIPSHSRDAPAASKRGLGEESGDVHHVQDEPPSCRGTAERDEVRSGEFLTSNPHITSMSNPQYIVLF